MLCVRFQLHLNGIESHILLVMSALYFLYKDSVFRKLVAQSVI